MSKQFNIFGDIVANDAERWFESDLTPGVFVGWLSKQEGDITININSNGGDVAGGLAIANAIKGYSKGEVVCNVLGVAASMASVIACAGKRLCMGQGAFLMVHNPWTVTMGNAEELRKDAETLDKMRDSILSFYQSKCPGKTADELKALMDAETWISREAAADYGFEVEDYEGEFRAAAALTRRAFGNAPDAVRAFLALKEKPAKEAAATDTNPTSPLQESAKEEPAEPAEEKPTATDTPETPAATTPAPAPEAPKETTEPVSCANYTKSAENWEARFKGLSAKFNELQSGHAAALAAKDAEIENFKSQLETSAKDLADANAKVSELSAKLDESTKALHAANADLAQTRDSLQKAEDKAAELVATRDLLTAGVLTPASEGTYADKMKAAKTPEEREALRAQKRAGKIK